MRRGFHQTNCSSSARTTVGLACVLCLVRHPNSAARPRRWTPMHRRHKQAGPDAWCSSSAGRAALCNRGVTHQCRSRLRAVAVEQELRALHEFQLAVPSHANAQRCQLPSQVWAHGRHGAEQSVTQLHQRVACLHSAVPVSCTLLPTWQCSRTLLHCQWCLHMLPVTKSVPCERRRAALQSMAHARAPASPSGVAGAYTAGRGTATSKWGEVLKKQRTQWLRESGRARGSGASAERPAVLASPPAWSGVVSHRSATFLSVFDPTPFRGGSATAGVGRGGEGGWEPSASLGACSASLSGLSTAGASPLFAVLSAKSIDVVVAIGARRSAGAASTTAEPGAGDCERPRSSAVGTDVGAPKLTGGSAATLSIVPL